MRSIFIIAISGLMAMVYAQNLTGMPSCAKSCLDTVLSQCSEQDCDCMQTSNLFEEFCNCSHGQCASNDYSSIFAIYDTVCKDDQPVVTFYSSDSMWYTLMPTTTGSPVSNATGSSTSTMTATSKPAPTSSSSASSDAIGETSISLILFSIINVVAFMIV
ncbi:hypothetical protein V1517DRAFT_330233 [Lipomyces orientalis]|uniref:Uncharacterized protein n=1 Tax=Lipomyces orientalis TaxID=1233043 RepID=A0ACC3TH09_9ASCO